VPIAIVTMVLLDYMIPDTYTDKLRVPEGLSPSSPGERGWIINPGGKDKPLEIWIAIACVIPAMLVYILLFMETHICEYVPNNN
jgi:HCO3- transporter family